MLLVPQVSAQTHLRRLHVYARRQLDVNGKSPHGQPALLVVVPVSNSAKFGVQDLAKKRARVADPVMFRRAMHPMAVEVGKLTTGLLVALVVERASVFGT